jgi:hypothetical protein
MKFEYGEKEKPKGDKAKDLKAKGRPVISDFGKDTKLVHRTLVN